MKKTFLLAIFSLFMLQAHTQIREFDNIEQLYDQGHFKKVLRKSNYLLDKPDFDHYAIPSLFKSLAEFQLAQTGKSKYSKYTEKSLESFVHFMENDYDSQAQTYYAEYIIPFQEHLYQKLIDYKRTDSTKAAQYHEILSNYFDEERSIHEISIDLSQKVTKVTPPKAASIENISKKEDIIDYAKQFIGVPYVYGGVSPKSGFDCSGFTSYVFKNQQEKAIPRVASDQQKQAKKIKFKNAQKGDLVFFGKSKNKVTHVGIVVDSEGKNIKMIHASTSKGVIITDIDQSEYWKSRLLFIGRY